jgi:hypothetical protein
MEFLYSLRETGIIASDLYRYNDDGDSFNKDQRVAERYQ